LPFTDQILVRITAGTNNYELLRTRSRFSKRLLDLPENTNEVLLWRQIKKSGAKALHIFQNSNNNNMRSATVYFKNQEDMTNISKSLMYYYNNKLRWANTKEQDFGLCRSQLVKDYEKVEAYPKRSEKSLGKRREFEQKQKEEKSSPQKKNRSNEGGKSNKQSYYRNSNRSLEYITQLAQLIQGLGEEVSRWERNAPNRS
jgi:hypothetical protein